MRAYNFLIEYSQGRTLRQSGEKLVARWLNDGEEFKDQMAFDAEDNIRPESILHWIEKQDPSPDNKYTEWLVIRFIKDIGIHLHDLESQAKPELEKYISHLTKNKIPNEFKDIQQVKSISHLSEIIRGVEEKGQQDTELDIANKKSVMDQAIQDKNKFEVVYDSPETRVIIPMSFEDSNFIYKQIKCGWCITHNQSYWNTYDINPKTSPAFYINDKNSNEWWAWVPHARNPEYRDINDALLTPDEIHKFNKTHPAAAKAIIKRAGGLEQLAINHPSYWFRYIKNPSETAQLAAVKGDGYAIQHIYNPSEAVQLAAVKRNGRAIKHIIDTGITPSEAVQWVAVNQNGSAIQWFENPSEAVQLAAVEQNGGVIESIIKKGITPSEEIKRVAVKTYGHAIKYIDNPSEEMQLAAVKQDGYVIKHIENPTEAVKLAAVNQFGRAIKYIDDPSEELQFAAVKDFGPAIKHIENPLEAVQLALVKRGPQTIEWIKNPSEAVKRAAQQNNESTDLTRLSVLSGIK